MKIILILILLTININAKENIKISYIWNYPSNLYITAPLNNKITFENGDRDKIYPWGFGFTSIGWQGISLITGIEFKTHNININKDELNIYYLTIPIGVKYISDINKKNNLRFTASTLFNFSLVSYGNILITPILSIGVIKQVKDITEEIYKTDVINGITFDLFFIPVKNKLNDVKSNNITIEKSFGIKIGYIFEGFWNVKTSE